MLCDHTETPVGLDGGGWNLPIVCVSGCLNRFPLLYTWNRGFTCRWTRAVHSLPGCGWGSIFHISLTVGDDPSGPAAVCCATGTGRGGGGLWSHRASAPFAGKQQDDVMLFVRLHCSYQMHYTEERVRNQCNIHFYNRFMSHHQKPHFSPSVLRCHVFMQLSLVLLRNEQGFWKTRCGFMDHNL